MAGTSRDPLGTQAIRDPKGPKGQRDPGVRGGQGVVRRYPILPKRGGCPARFAPDPIRSDPIQGTLPDSLGAVEARAGNCSLARASPALCAPRCERFDSVLPELKVIVGQSSPNAAHGASPDGRDAALRCGPAVADFIPR